MDIVFNVNPLGLEGLGATLTSLIRNCSNSRELKLWFFCSEFNKNDKINIMELLLAEQFEGTMECIDFDAKGIFGHLRSLHGDWTPYGRLLIADYIPSNTALYLDADLIIQLDVLNLKNFNFKGNVLAAVYGSTVEWALENTFFIDKLKWSPKSSYFNSGVLLFNLKEWRNSNIEKQWKNLSSKYPNDFLSADQTILNAVCGGNFAYLSSEYNNQWCPGFKAPADAGNSIIHFVGSPKPWDLFGKFFHEGYRTWETYNNKSWKKKYGKLTLKKMKRTWKIRNSFFKNLIKLLQKQKAL